MRLNPFILPIALIVALLGTTWVAQAAGMWSTSGREAIDPETMTAADLKGWMTLQQVMDGLRLSKDAVYAAGKIPAEVPTGTALKDLEKLVPGFETSVLRDALSANADMPAATPTPASAPPAPVATSAPTVEHTGTGTGPTPLPAGQVLAAAEIKGRMTLADVAQQCAVPLDALLAGLKLPASTDSATAIKDLISQGMLTDVSDVQKVVEALQRK